MASSVKIKISMEARSCNFRTDSYKFRKGKITGAQRSNLPPNSPPPQKGILLAPKYGKNCAVARQCESCAKVVLRNIAIFWWDYRMMIRTNRTKWTAPWGRLIGTVSEIILTTSNNNQRSTHMAWPPLGHTMPHVRNGSRDVTEHMTIRFSICVIRQHSVLTSL